MMNLTNSVLVGARLAHLKGATTGRRIYGLLAVLGLVLMLGVPAAYTQQANGTVSGSVVDQKGEVVPGASVVLHNVASGAEMKTTSDAKGLYVFNYVPVGTYTLRVSITGFKTFAQTGIHVAPSAVLQENAALQVGSIVQTVQVQSSDVNLIPTQSSGEIRTIDASQIQNLSTVGRGALELLQLLPGVVGGTGIPGADQNGGYDASQGTGFQVNSGGVSNFNVNGLRSDQNVIKLDNTYAMDPGENGGFVVEPNMDMIQEFSVKTSGFEASQGGAGVIVDAVTKSGGNKIHGEAYWYLRNAAFNANDFSNNLAGIAKPNSKFNYPGFNIGGPVRFPWTKFNKHNDKMFFFYGMELQRQLADSGTVLRVVPTAAMRNGDFSQLLNPKFCTTNSAGVVTGGNYLSMPCIVNDIATGKPAPGNVLPANEVTAAGQEILNGNYLLPNYVDPTGGTNLASHPMYPTNRIENIARVDYNISENTRAYVRLAQNSDHEYYPYGLWAGANSFGNGDSPLISPIVGHDSGESATLNVVSVISPTLTNEVQFGANAIRYPYKFQDPQAMASSKLLSALPGLNWAEGSGGSLYTRSVQVPQVWDALNNASDQTWGQGDLYNGVFGNKTVFDLSDNLTKIKGTHTLQFGFSYTHTRNDQNQADTQGQIWTSAWGDGGNTTGNTFGDLLAQGVTDWDQATNNPDGQWRYTNYEWYAQDSWKVTRKLTLNYGARFAHLPPWYEARGEVAAFNPRIYNPANGASILDGVQVGSGINLLPPANKALVALQETATNQYATGLPSSGGFPNTGVWFEPRVGFAYDLFGTGKTVLRGGYGIYTERDQGNTVFGAADQPPFEFNASPATINTNITKPGGGFAAISAINPLSSVGGIAATDYDQGDHHGTQSYSWNFTLDQDIGLKTILEVAYVGTTGNHLYIENILPQDAIPLGGLWCGSSTSLVSAANCAGVGQNMLGLGTAGNENAYRLYKPFGAIDILHHVSTSNYNALQATARRNVSHGLTLLVSYTYSKSLGYSGSFNGTVDPFNSRLNYGLQSYDRPQNLSISYIYQLPNAADRYFSTNKFAKGVLNNWQLSGISNFQSGAPESVSVGTLTCSQAKNAAGTNTNLCTTSGNNELFDGASTWYGTPDRSLNPILLMNPQKGSSYNGVGSTWLNPASITLPQINQMGTYEMPQFLGPGSYNFDLTLFKSFKLGQNENRRLEFRVSAFDIFNRAQPDNPQTTSANITWNVPANATNLSQGTPSGVTNVPVSGQGCTTGDFGCIVDKHGHREMEFAIKLYF